MFAHFLVWIKMELIEVKVEMHHEIWEEMEFDK